MHIPRLPACCKAPTLKHAAFHGQYCQSQISGTEKERKVYASLNCIGFVL